MKKTYEFCKFPSFKAILHHQINPIYATMNELSSDNNKTAVCNDKYG